VGLALLAGFLAFFAIAAFKDWQFKKGLDESRQAYDEWQEEFYQRALADNVGGKTPQDTLRMYIEAVEKGDYELASKYFILEKQEKWFSELSEISKVGKINLFLDPIREALALDNGKFSESNKIKYFTISEPIAIDLGLYPSGVWKLIEI
jgi:hypothetical protein